MFDWLQVIADFLTYTALGLLPESKLGSAVNFFIFDTVKILILLMIIIYAITFIRSYFPPEKTKKMGQNGYIFAMTEFNQEQLFQYILEDRKRLLKDT